MANEYILIENYLMGGRRMTSRKYTVKSTKANMKSRNITQRKLNEESAVGGCQQLVLSGEGQVKGTERFKSSLPAGFE